MKEEFKIARANGVIPYSNRRFFKNPTYKRSFSDSNGRRYGLNDGSLYNHSYQSGFANGMNAKQPFILVGGEATTTGPTLSPQRAPSGISIEVQDAVPKE
jgi:hypothetical protein